MTRPGPPTSEGGGPGPGASLGSEAFPTDPGPAVAPGAHADPGFEDWRELNRAAWDERVPVHLASRFYDVEGFRDGREVLRPFELAEVGPVAGRSLVHLQCHFGQDTLAWARHGAQVTGLDFSPLAVDAARRLAEGMRISQSAEFVVADVYDAPEALAGRRFGIVYTGFGALNWLPDIERWADVVSRLVEPGGFLYLAEFHPVADIFGDDDLTVEHDTYFGPEPFRSVNPGTYTDGEFRDTDTVMFEWNHGLGEVVSALLAAGLRVDSLHEYDLTLWPRWPFLERHDDGTYHMPPGRPRVPLIYTLKATRPT